MSCPPVGTTVNPVVLSYMFTVWGSWFYSLLSVDVSLSRNPTLLSVNVLKPCGFAPYMSHSMKTSCCRDETVCSAGRGPWSSTGLFVLGNRHTVAFSFTSFCWRTDKGWISAAAAMICSVRRGALPNVWVPVRESLVAVVFPSPYIYCSKYNWPLAVLCTYQGQAWDLIWALCLLSNSSTILSD